MKKIIVLWQVIFDIYVNSLKESGKKRIMKKKLFIVSWYTFLCKWFFFLSFYMQIIRFDKVIENSIFY